MAIRFLGQPLSSGTARRIAVVLAIVLSLHAVVLYEVAIGLNQPKPEDATQTTLTVALLAPAPPPAPAAAPTPPPRAARAPRPTAPSLPPPEPAAPPPPEPAPAPEPPPVEPVPEPVIPIEPAPAPEEPRLPAPVLSSIPTKGRIAYRTTYTRLRGITAMTFVDWNVDPSVGRYELWLRTVDPAGLLDLKSTGTLQPFGIAPERYVERLELANRELRAEFDWRSHLVAFFGRGAHAPMSFVDGTQDPLSLQFDLPLLAQAYPWRFTPGSTVEFDIARRDIERYVFRVQGYEAVKIDGRDVQALRLERPRGPTASRSVELWMAPEYQWLPVRLRFIDHNDEIWDSVLATLPGEELPPAPGEDEPVKP